VAPTPPALLKYIIYVYGHGELQTVPLKLKFTLKKKSYERNLTPTLPAETLFYDKIFRENIEQQIS
jgi:hypothetical protein